MKLHDEWYADLPYAGPAPGLPGVQQVNVCIAEYCSNMITEVLVCLTPGIGTRLCSPPA